MESAAGIGPAFFAHAVTELVKRFPSYADLIQAYDERWEESIAGPLQGTGRPAGCRCSKPDSSCTGVSNWAPAKSSLRCAPGTPFVTAVRDDPAVRRCQTDQAGPQDLPALLERIGRSAGECVFIDDSDENITTAGSLGSRRFDSSRQINYAENCNSVGYCRSEP